MNKVGEIVEIRSYQHSDLDALVEVGKDEKIWEYYKLGGWTKALDVVSWEEKDKARENVDGTWADFAHFELKKL